MGQGVQLPAPTAADVTAAASAAEASTAAAASTAGAALTAAEVAAPDTILRQKLDCPICYELLHEPAALPCGHIFCRPCGARTLDQAFDQPPLCPLCRSDLSSFLGWINGRAAAQSGGHGVSQISVCTILQDYLNETLPAEAAARAAQARASEAAGKSHTHFPRTPRPSCVQCITDSCSRFHKQRGPQRAASRFPSSSALWRCPVCVRDSTYSSLATG